MQWSADSSRTAVAVEGSLSEPVGDNNGISSNNGETYRINLVFGHRHMANGYPYLDGVGIHCMLGYLWERTNVYWSSPGDRHWINQVSFGAGGETRLTRHVKFIVEYMNSTPYNLWNNNDEIDGLINFGIRIHGAQLAADIAGIRPLTSNELGTLFAIPLLTISYRMGN